MRNAIGVFLLAIAYAATAFGGPREAALAELDRIPSDWTDLNLRARINDGGSKELKIGTEVTMSIEAARECHVSLAHVDSHGVVSVMKPRFGESRGLLSGPGEMNGRFTGKVAALVAPPLGRETLYVVATQRPIDTEAVAGDLALLQHGVGKDAAGAVIARRFRETLAASPGASAVVKLEYRVLGRSPGVEYTSKDIVDYFTQRSKSLYRPSLDVHVNFEFDSAALTEKARKVLDVWGEALKDEAMESAAFVVGGHTDDVGTERYNLKLSRRRAQAVEEYLNRKFGVDAKRLSVKAYGESRPLEPQKTPEARAANRRVEFELNGL